MNRTFSAFSAFVFRASNKGDKIQIGQMFLSNASGGQNQKWPTCGQGGYVTPAVSGIPTASEWGDKIRSGPLVGKVATSPLPSRGSPSLQSGGTESEGAHLWARWLRHPCRLGDPHRFRAGGQNQKWPTCGQGGYVTPAVSGIPTASEWGDKIRSGPLVGKVATSPLPSRGSPPLQSGGARSEVAHLWARWLRNPCRLGDPHLFRAGGQNQKWPTCGQGGYVTPAVSEIPTASEWGDKIRNGPLVGKVATSPLPSRGSPSLQSGGTESEGAHLWARWLPHPCRLGDPHRFRVGGQNQKWPTCGQGGYVTPAVLGIPTASERGAKSEVAHKWSKMLYSGSVRCAKQTLPPIKGGGFGYVKTLLLPKNLANEKRGGVCKTPHAVVLRRTAPPLQPTLWQTLGQQ